MRIWKFTLDITDEQTVGIPLNYRALTVQMQNGVLCMWALVDPDSSTVTRKVFVVGTGNPCDHISACQYLGSVQERAFVWHVFMD